ncbi:response regulator [Solimicrobium silvestre]|uniref:Virulence sensor protein BvgS n=1 Tax=Solimicrobium silvestre TaxID=2099400 RepID=A0A2S9GU99_9BURK|nr:response regulator [Solimicrobium silvestre]PRC91236.1 Histidine kinase-, DNA gyrase B-, and HSP90-like ATPase [Solimicrobium silvestre]
MRLTVTQRMVFLIGTAIVGIAIMVGIGQYMMEKVYDSANNANVNAVPSLLVLGELRKNFDQTRMLVYRHILSYDDAKMAAMEVSLTAERQNVVESIQKYETNGCLGVNCFADDKDKSYLDQEKVLWAKFNAQIDAILVESRKGERGMAKAREGIESTLGLTEDISMLIDQHFAYNAEVARKFSVEAAATKSRALNLMLVLGILAAASIGLLGTFIARTILRLLGGEPEEAAAIAGRLALGDVSSTIDVIPGDTTSLMAKIKVLIETMRRIANRADAVGLGNLTDEVEILSGQDKLGKAINNMVTVLRSAKVMDDRRNWISDGNSQLSAALTGDFTLQQIADSAISVLGSYLGAGRGVLYVLRPDGSSLDLLGSYMYTERVNLGTSFKIGEGAIGQVAREKKPIILTTIAVDAAPIITGTTCAPPLYTYTYPLLRDNLLLGAVELGSFERFDEVKLEFLHGAVEVIASSLHIAEQRGQISKLLSVAEQAERDVRAQNENLQEINAQMEEQQQQLQQQSGELQLSNSQMEEQQQQLQQQSEELQQTNAQMEEQQKLLEKNNAELRHSQSDIDEKAKQLEQSNQYKSEFLANMSHELRTPLNAIILLSKMMADNHEGRLGATEIKRAEVIHRSGEDLLHLINDVLDLSKVDAGHMDLNFVMTSSASMTMELKDLFGSTAQSRGLEFIVQDQLQSGFISDPGKISQILRNLLSNAFKFTKEGSVSLVLERSPSEYLPLRIKVIDSGIGIPKNKLGTIFEAFRQVDGSTSREFGGTGLGLTISLRFAELLGGTIKVQSVEGKGSEFVLCLPDIPPELSARQSENEQLTAAAKGNEFGARLVSDDRDQLTAGDKVILLIDDDREFCSAIVDINHRLGYKTIVANCGADGVAFARKYKPAGILLDLGLPDINGIELLDNIKASSDLAMIPVYIVSAKDRDAALGRSNIVGYLQKPVVSNQIAEAEALLLAAIANVSDAGVLIVAGRDKSRNASCDDGSGAVLNMLKSTPNIGQRELREVSLGAELPAALEALSWGAVVIDLTQLSIKEGLSVAKTVRANNSVTALLFCGVDHLNDEEEASLRIYTDCIIVNTPKSEQRLLENIERFLRTVPLKDDANVARINDSFKGARLTGKSIMVVDDDPRNLFVITAALEQEGARVISAINGLWALELLKKEKVNLMITDIMMPEMDGYQTITAVRANPAFASIPIIALTAKAMPQDRENILEIGADDYLSKPVDYDVLNNMAALWCSKKH